MQAGRRRCWQGGGGREEEDRDRRIGIGGGGSPRSDLARGWARAMVCGLEEGGGGEEEGGRGTSTSSRSPSRITLWRMSLLRPRGRGSAGEVELRGEGGQDGLVRKGGKAGVAEARIIKNGGFGP